MGQLSDQARAALVGTGWFASILLIGVATDNVDVQGLLALVVTLGAGALAGSWWILLAPGVAAVGFLIADPLSPCDDCREELGMIGSAFLYALAAAAVAVLLAAGVGARSLVDRSGGAPGPPG